MKRLVFKDKQGRLYRDIDAKGIGYVSENRVKIPGEEHRPGFFNGFLESKNAFDDYKASERFISAGIRTPRVLGIIHPEEIIYGDEKISLEDARGRGIVKDYFQPAILIRAFGTKARVSDIFYGTELSEETKKLMLEDAKMLVSQELGRERAPLDNHEYLGWFAETLGNDVGIMHKKGWYHYNLRPHNITLDCRIGDLDTVRELKNEKQRNLDVDFAKTNSLQKLVRWLDLPETQYFELENLFQKKYDSVFPPEEGKFGK